MTYHRRLDPLEQIYDRIKHHVLLMLRTNTFWLCLLWMLWEFGKNLDPSWLAQHINFKTWMPPILAALGILVKIIQNIHDEHA